MLIFQTLHADKLEAVGGLVLSFIYICLKLRVDIPKLLMDLSKGPGGFVRSSMSI